MKEIIVNQRTYASQGNRKAEIGGGISMTIPNQVVPLKTLVDKYVRGFPVPQSAQVYTGEDPLLNSVDGLDQQDRLTLARELEKEARQTQKKIENDRKEYHKNKAAEEKAAKEALKDANETL